MSKQSRTAKDIVNSILKKLPIIIAALIWIAPFYIALVYSFKTKQEIAETLFSFPKRLYLGQLHQGNHRKPSLSAWR